ncbi:MAG: hypothetical protein AB7O52_02475 [Planctomycetota bacterium]
MRERNLWNMPCPLRDTILWSSFTIDELERMATAARHPLRRFDHLEPQVSVMIAAHRACSSDNAFARACQAALDQRASRVMAWVASATELESYSVSRGPTEQMPATLPEFLWAVARDPRPELARVEQVLEWRLTVEGVRQYSFGKVELIAI